MITAEYYAPHLAHATMEPPAATARMADGKWEVWTSVQSPGGARDDVAKRLGVDPKNVTLHSTLLGGGFGRKSKCDFAIEAALLSKAMDGAPVKVVWTREDDIRHGFYHTVTAERLEAGLDTDNKVVAWRHRSAAPSLHGELRAGPETSAATSSSAWDGSTRRSTCRTSAWRAARRRSHVRIGWFRSVNNVAHAWAIQSFVAEIANELGRDPKDFLLELIGPARIVDAPKQVTTPWWNYGEPHDIYPIDTGAAAEGDRAGRREGRLGQEAAARPRARHRRAPQLRQLHRHGGRGRGGRQGQDHDPARRYRDRLRLLRQSRARPLADRRRGRDGAVARQVRRDHAQERPRRAEQLQRLSGRSASTNRRP